MARADLLSDLVKQGMSGDKIRFKRVVESIIAEERAKKHTVLADNLEKMLQAPDIEKNPSNLASIIDQRVTSLVQELVPEKNFADLVLPKTVVETCEELIQEQHRADLLRSYNLEPRSRVLLIGPPGNGKTSLAEAIANALMVPFLLVRYDAVIGTYLGETAVRLRRLLDFARSRHCVLFFDEFETLGKERGDRHETGEIKRVVSSLLMQIDQLPSYVVVIGATNHAELLDRAVWRRFQVRMNLPQPTRARIADWFAKYERSIGVDLGYSPETLAKRLLGSNFSEVEEFGATVFRKYVLGQPESNMKAIVSNALSNWASRTVKTKQQNGGVE